ncbi:hemerythrin domain-containing protein [Halothermothrix orenii]|uniref:Hemerythrin HHE cation binding domain protein n=1 Tax=Halothermothrix orenii (strain H 168 / OCM 544 / DSM 9562) TaxID=373903 RepID=B8D0N5_HALOH|nr:hemerythrin domain-containing protein [Halothermothrix orenii]ACL70971.1 Hemerythrin HHE cation binding domain protein [Halothermothrix orenii H 168]
MGPVEILKWQHNQIEKMIKEFEPESKDFKKGELTPEYGSLMQRVNEHFALEEGPMLEMLSTLVDIEERTINFITEDHEKIKKLMEKLKGDGDIHNFSRKIMSHMKKEEETVYFMVDNFLTEEQLGLLMEKMELKNDFLPIVD